MTTARKPSTPVTDPSLDEAALAALAALATRHSTLVEELAKQRPPSLPLDASPSFSPPLHIAPTSYVYTKPVSRADTCLTPHGMVTPGQSVVYSERPPRPEGREPLDHHLALVKRVYAGSNCCADLVFWEPGRVTTLPRVPLAGAPTANHYSLDLSPLVVDG